jgi:hypothetical protein
MAYNWTTEWPGVYARHDDDCQLRNGGECTCAHVTYRASAKAPDQHSRMLSPEFDTALEARDWLRDQRARLTAAMAVADEGPSVSTVIKDFVAAAERGEARGRDGAPYTRPRLSQLRAGLAYVDSELGGTPLQAVRRRHVQALVDELHTAGLSPDRVIEVVSTFRDLFVYAIQRDLADFNPIVQLRLPADEPPMPAPVAVATAAYPPPQPPVGLNGNGHGNVDNMANWRPAATAAEPFDDEPTYGPGMAGPEESPAPPPQQATPEPPPASGPHPNATPEPTPYATPDPQPYATPEPAPYPTPDPHPYAMPQTHPYATPEPHPFGPPRQSEPPLGPPMGTQLTPLPMPPPGYPYDTAPMFAQPQTRMLTPIGAETHYGTPTYGAESVPTQRTVQAPTSGNDTDGVFLSEQMFWWITRIVVIVFVLIAIVLAAESV